MVDFIVSTKQFNCTDILHDGSNSYSDEFRRRKYRSLDTATNTKEKRSTLNSIMHKEKSVGHGVFSRTTNEESKEEETHESGSVFGVFGRRRNKRTERNIRNPDNSIGRTNVKSFKPKSDRVRNIFQFFRSSIPTHGSGLHRQSSDIVSRNIIGTSSPAHNSDHCRRLFRQNVESIAMETTETVTEKTIASSIDSVSGEHGLGIERVVGMDETPKINTPYEDVDYRRLASEIFVKNLGSTCRYISDICVPESRQEIVQFLDELRELSRSSPTGQLRIVSCHDTHLHIVHTCPYSNGSCRCTWLQGSAIWRTRRLPQHRRRVYAADITTPEWENIFRYFTTNGHSVQDIESGSPNGRICLRLKNIQVIV
uniref:Putative nonstructural protein n=1 Tax=Phylloscopus schwarzi parvoviridae sp. TaxID=2794533 RepID=A0A8A4XDN0_9VIRU|nr:MAG: putative nonstructural protein [Phylloscopus schwarzi parvoviridae sp.]